MTQVIDVRSSGGELAIVGGGLVLPTSSNADTTPSDGAIRYNSGTGYVELYTDGQWTLIGGPALAQMSYPGTLPSDQRCMIVPIVMNMQLPANFAGSAGYCGTNATGTVAFNVSYIHAASPVSIGTVTFSSSAHTPVFSTQAAVNFVAGDVLLMNTPSVADFSLADVGITLLILKQ